MSAVTLESFLEEIQSNIDNNNDSFTIKLNGDDLWIGSAFYRYYRKNKKQYENYYLAIDFERDVKSGKVTYFRYHFQRKETEESGGNNFL